MQGTLGQQPSCHGCNAESEDDEFKHEGELAIRFNSETIKINVPPTHQKVSM